MGQTSPRWQLCLASQPVGGTALALLGLASNGLLKRATCPPRHWVRSAGAVGDSKRTNITI